LLVIEGEKEAAKEDAPVNLVSLEDNSDPPPSPTQNSLFMRFSPSPVNSGLQITKNFVERGPSAQKSMLSSFLSSPANKTHQHGEENNSHPPKSLTPPPPPSPFDDLHLPNVSRKSFTGSVEESKSCFVEDDFERLDRTEIDPHFSSDPSTDFLLFDGDDFGQRKSLEEGSFLFPFPSFPS